MRIAHDYPEDWEDRIESMLDAGDQLRKERRELADSPSQEDFDERDEATSE